MTRDELLANLREARHLVVGTAPTISRFRETIDEAIRVIEQQAGRRFPIQGEARCGAKTVRQHLGTQISEADLDRAFSDLRGKLEQKLRTATRASANISRVA